RLRGHRLPGAGLAHDPERLPSLEAEVHPVPRLHAAARGVERDAEALHPEELASAGGAAGRLLCAVGHSALSLTSNFCRSASPRKFRAHTVITMTTPGTNTRCGYWRKFAPPAATTRPHDIVSPGTPRPRMARLASATMTMPTLSIAIDIIA